jgi:hypothetical protein
MDSTYNHVHSSIILYQGTIFNNIVPWYIPGFYNLIIVNYQQNPTKEFNIR